MIRVFEVTAPLGDRDPQASVDMLHAATEMLRRLYMPLISFQAAAEKDVLTLTIRVSAKNQWACSGAARKIGSNLLLRLKIPAEQGTMQLVGTELPGSSLTAERGRNVSNHRPRGAGTQKASEAVS